jgi:tetrahydromethanopterin S-methyltransferase subunit G
VEAYGSKSFTVCELAADFGERIGRIIGIGYSGCIIIFDLQKGEKFCG